MGGSVAFNSRTGGWDHCNRLLLRKYDILEPEPLVKTHNASSSYLGSLPSTRSLVVVCSYFTDSRACPLRFRPRGTSPKTPFLISLGITDPRRKDPLVATGVTRTI
ncbi:hypothetical protein TNCV_4428741 [Trichonephila clavipes]|nr:hypothetical protein TNCV_4428741 [Trichonephila clavipes]